MIATDTKVELKGIDEKAVEKVGEEGYFTRDKPSKQFGEEQFFKQGEKAEVSSLLGDLVDWNLEILEADDIVVVEEEAYVCACGRSESCRQGAVG